MIQNTHWKQLARNWAFILFGNALYSLAVALFLEPAGLITGGATGIALAIGRLTSLAGPLPSTHWPAASSARPFSASLKGCWRAGC